MTIDEPNECPLDEDTEDYFTDVDFEKRALEHGIPLSVIRGETKLSDHFSKEYINWKRNLDEDEK